MIPPPLKLSGRVPLEDQFEKVAAMRAWAEDEQAKRHRTEEKLMDARSEIARYSERIATLERQLAEATREKLEYYARYRLARPAKKLK